MKVRKRELLIHCIVAGLVNIVERAPGVTEEEFAERVHATANSIMARVDDFFAFPAEEDLT